jgi:hypothetical protein
LHAVWTRWTGRTGSAHFFVGDKTVFILIKAVKRGRARSAHFVHGNGTIFIQVRALKETRTFAWRRGWTLLGKNRACQHHKTGGGENCL